MDRIHNFGTNDGTDPKFHKSLNRRYRHSPIQYSCPSFNPLYNNVLLALERFTNAMQKSLNLSEIEAAVEYERATDLGPCHTPYHDNFEIPTSIIFISADRNPVLHPLFLTTYLSDVDCSIVFQ
jgi:hypothetical protein